MYHPKNGQYNEEVCAQTAKSIRIGKGNPKSGYERDTAGRVSKQIRDLSEVIQRTCRQQRKRFGLLRSLWIPAYAGMTESKVLLLSLDESFYCYIAF